MQGEQRSLLSALEAVESALHDARQACDEQSALRQRYEGALEGKTQALTELKRELREARKAAEQVSGSSTSRRKNCTWEAQLQRAP